MKGKTITGIIVSLLICLSLAAPLPAAQFTVEVTNLTHGIYFTPLLVTAHDSVTNLFEGGTSASANLQLMAECGDISGLLTDLGGEDADTVANPAGGVLAPGATAIASIDTTMTGNTHLSIVAMLLPTNDGFVGLDSLPVPDTAGIYVYYLNGYDAGTEENSELLDTSGCGPGMPGIPAAPGGDGGTGGSGVASSDSNTTVHIHRGNLGDTDAAGGNSDLDSRIHRWLNPVARVTITVQ
jgi:hypothetical protein